MIPKIIHYCWFGHRKLPRLAKKCIKSWKKFFPDYEIRVWNEDNFDVNAIPYTREAYRMGKYAFVSDYARFKILYEYGGLYFDTDVEVIKSMKEILDKGGFMGLETDPIILEGEDMTTQCQINTTMSINSGFGLAVAPGLGLAITPRHHLYKKILDMYARLSFLYDDGSLNITTTVVGYVTNLLISNGLKPRKGIIDFEGIKIYPAEYFCPMNNLTRKLCITPNTCTIHWYTASWLNPRERILDYITHHCGQKTMLFVVSLWRSSPIATLRSYLGIFKCYLSQKTK